MKNVTLLFLTLIMTRLMYPIDRRIVANRLYSIIHSLRKVALFLDVSHTTVARWLKNPERKCYKQRSKTFDSTDLVSCLKIAISTNPFLTTNQLRDLFKTTFSLTLSKELIRCAIHKLGFSRKKARFYGAPSYLQEKIIAFVNKRSQFIREERSFISIDETSFGRHGFDARGYAPIGKPLYVRKRIARSTTVSVCAGVSMHGIEFAYQVNGSFNTQRFVHILQQCEFSRGTVLLMDNVRFHHAIKVKELAVDKGWELLYVPPYSPWFNPIEGVFSIVKRAYSHQNDIENSFKSVSKNHCIAFFENSNAIGTLKPIPV